MCAAPSRVGGGGAGRERYVRVFEACDEDKKGYLSREDFKVAVVMLFGYKPSKELDTILSGDPTTRSPVDTLGTRWQEDGDSGQWSWRMTDDSHPVVCQSRTSSLLQRVQASPSTLALACVMQERGDLVEVDSVMASVQQKNSDRGFLTLEDFKRAFNSIAPKLPERIIVEAFREVDQDSDGHVSFKEFESAMNYGQNEVSQLHFA
ncbi:EF-hand calcium-binding domain-containing protein 11 isoform X2 [Gopherus flavomarginatus]|uniref:EF-hand calcium-binding domain-containing protein 11 isoform X2 n=1 Tax=Gopherus flavomarginatus TaxID=286002 RepID=UPI0021CC3111|nr:EF-hand calcium-binding domain-containing protein 11 isoform X2 [Gopherus flavomarginatus]